MLPNLAIWIGAELNDEAVGTHPYEHSTTALIIYAHLCISSHLCEPTSDPRHSAIPLTPSLRMRLVQRIHPLLIPLLSLLFILVLARLLLSLSQQPPLDPSFFPFAISIAQDLSVWDQEDGKLDEFFADVYETISVG
jgi:hypothetical protein